MEEEIKEEDEGVTKKLIEREDRTLLWVFITIGLVFAIILVPYFIHQASKKFTYNKISWFVENPGNLVIFHGRFLSLTNPKLHYNIFLRKDPRKNNINVSGKLNSFKYGGAISLSPKVDRCRGDLSRVMLDLAAFLKQGVGVGPIISASSDEITANRTGRKYITCENTHNRTVVLIKMGKDKVIQDKNNHYCYTIYASSCEDSSSVEKFMVEAVKDFRDVNPIKATS